MQDLFQGREFHLQERTKGKSAGQSMPIVSKVEIYKIGSSWKKEEEMEKEKRYYSNIK